MTEVPLDEKRQANLENWEDRVPVHLGPDGYALDEFDNPDHLSRVVRFDLPRLGDLHDVDVVHLQCHIGTDTVSLDRLGAKSVTGYDFSPAAIAAARDLAKRARSKATFVHGELYDSATVLGADRFDLVFTGIGALVWLPDITGWAAVVAQLLRPGGRLFIRDAHPTLLSIADTSAADPSIRVQYPACGAAGSIRFEEALSYEGDGTALAHTTTYQWNWSISEIVTALIDAGLHIDSFTEHRTVPWNALEGAMVTVGPLGEYELADRPERLPCTFTLQASLQA